MGTSDAFFVGVAKDNPTSAATADTDAVNQTKNSAFLTVQSFTNFAAASGAITVAWRALQAVDSERFTSNWCPFVMSIAWLVVSLVTSAGAGSANTTKLGFWLSGLFLGFFNALTLFAAVIGLNTVK